MCLHYSRHDPHVAIFIWPETAESICFSDIWITSPCTLSTLFFWVRNIICVVFLTPLLSLVIKKEPSISLWLHSLPQGFSWYIFVSNTNKSMLFLSYQTACQKQQNITLNCGIHFCALYLCKITGSSIILMEHTQIPPSVNLEQMHDYQNNILLSFLDIFIFVRSQTYTAEYNPENAMYCIMFTVTCTFWPDTLDFSKHCQTQKCLDHPITLPILSNVPTMHI